MTLPEFYETLSSVDRFRFSALRVFNGLRSKLDDIENCKDGTQFDDARIPFPVVTSYISFELAPGTLEWNVRTWLRPSDYKIRGAVCARTTDHTHSVCSVILELRFTAFDEWIAALSSVETAVLGDLQQALEKNNLREVHQTVWSLVHVRKENHHDLT